MTEKPDRDRLPHESANLSAEYVDKIGENSCK